MEPVLIIGIIIVSGFLLGELVAPLGLPKITGYMLAGILLNPGLTHFIPASFVEHTAPVTKIALSFITFSVGGIFIMNQPLSAMSFIHPFLIITGSIVLGACFGLVLNKTTRLIENENEGTFIVLVFGLLALCYGVAEKVGNRLFVKKIRSVGLAVIFHPGR